MTARAEVRTRPEFGGHPSMEGSRRLGLRSSWLYEYRSKLRAPALGMSYLSTLGLGEPIGSL